MKICTVCHSEPYFVVAMEGGKRVEQEKAGRPAVRIVAGREVCVKPECAEAAEADPGPEVEEEEEAEGSGGRKKKKKKEED